MKFLQTLTSIAICYTLQTSLFVPTGVSVIPALEMEIYRPAGDTVAERPLIIHMHTGTFLPIILNGNPTGSRFDAATSMMCQGYAKRGYVVANIEYRLGWNPMDSTQALRAASLMKAVYRGIQDAKLLGLELKEILDKNFG